MASIACFRLAWLFACLMCCCNVCLAHRLHAGIVSSISLLCCFPLSLSPSPLSLSLSPCRPGCCRSRALPTLSFPRIVGELSGLGFRVQGLGWAKSLGKRVSLARYKHSVGWEAARSILNSCTGSAVKSAPKKSDLARLLGRDL